MTTSTPPPPLPPYPEPPAGGRPPPAAPRPPLRRSRTDKVIGGVSGGLAEHTGIDALLWRVGFIALVFAGGTGFLLYLLLWLLMPARPVDPTAAAAPSAPPEPRSPVPGITVAALLIVVGLTALVARTTAWAPGPVVFLAVALLVVGLGLGVGAFVGGRSARGPLIALGVFLSFALVIASVLVDVGSHDRRSGLGDRSYAPTRAADVRPVYQSGIGDLTLDLTGVDLAGLAEPIHTEVRSGVGDVQVILPESADVEALVQNGPGETQILAGDAGTSVLGGSSGGYSAGSGAAWSGDDRLEFDLVVQSGIGDVTVSRG